MSQNLSANKIMRILKETDKKYCYIMEMEVRDYELDCQQIVNNANYLHYMEHTRHRFCRDAGLSFTEMHNRGIDPVVRKIDVVYKTSLRGGDTFLSCIRLERKGPLFIFRQDILKSNGEICAEATISIVILKNGKVTRGDEIAEAFSKYIK